MWKGIGLNFITYLAALQNVSVDLLEAAQIDGASKWQRIKNIVIPMISPTTFFLLISSVITSLQNFTTIQALTGGCLLYTSYHTEADGEKQASVKGYVLKDL